MLKYSQDSINQAKQDIIASIPSYLPQELLDEVDIVVSDSDAKNMLSYMNAGISKDNAIAETINNIIDYLEADNSLPSWWQGSIN